MLLQIPLDIPDVKIEKFDASSKKGFVITVTSEQNGTTCQHCGKSIDKFYGYSKEITLRHLPILETPVWIKIKPNDHEGAASPREMKDTVREAADRGRSNF